MKNSEVKQQLINIANVLGSVSVKGDDVLALAQVFKGLEYTINQIEEDPVEKEE